MPIKVQGLRELEKQLNVRFGPVHSKRWIDKALLEGAKHIKKAIYDNFDEFKDTGKSQKEITISDPIWLNGKRTIKIHWRGPNKRYRIIHLNEFGTVKNPNPKGKGAVDRAIRQSREIYFKTLKSEVERYMR